MAGSGTDGGEGIIGTGSPELDAILFGGLPANRVYLVEGNPGTGKTTLAMQFLLEGLKTGESGMYVAISETPRELRSIAASHGWTLDGILIYELLGSEDSLDVDAQYSMFHPSEVELGATTKGVLEFVEKHKPRRIAFDSLSELRLLAQNPLRYRRQILALKQFFAGRDCTVLLLDDRTSNHEDLQVQSIAHGVISLESIASEYGDERRRLRIRKLRGRQYMAGYHDFEIVPGGLAIYPRKSLVPSEPHGSSQFLKSGNQSLDRLLGDGISPGTSALLLGPAGTGKSSCATLYAISAASRGERAAMFTFDESVETLMQRAEGLGMDLAPHVESGRIDIHKIDPGEVSPGEFAHMVRKACKARDGEGPVSVVVIDSLNGYLASMPEERFLTMQLHELLSYLSAAGIVTFLVVTQHGMLGATMSTPVDASYLADAVILFRYFEAQGEIRQAISVVKKRSGSHERTIREFSMRNGCIAVGEPLREFQGVLGGIPNYRGTAAKLMEKTDG
ncbi:MAG TPA: ATPase domain-containing protein [Pirellulaceae bacterium]|jgi:circadian clock protein KaiC|nr:ATPase domain-containing protein [Pirellulaceae bacterium]